MRGGKSGHPFSGNREVSKASLTATGNKHPAPFPTHVFGKGAGYEAQGKSSPDARMEKVTTISKGMEGRNRDILAT